MAYESPQRPDENLGEQDQASQNSSDVPAASQRPVEQPRKPNPEEAAKQIADAQRIIDGGPPDS